MGPEMSEREVLDSLSLSQLRTLAKAFDIDIKPKISEMPLLKLRGEKHFIADKIYEVIGITIEDIDKILGTNFSKTRPETTKTADTGKADFRITLLSKYVDEEDIQVMLFDLSLSVSGSKDAQIERLIASGKIHVPDIVKLLNREALVEICESLGLDSTGTDDELRNQISAHHGAQVPVE